MSIENPKKDPILSITNDIPISRNNDGSWFINNSSIRINVLTPDDDEQWKNIEMTGYVKVKPRMIGKATAFATYSPDADKSNEENNDIIDIDWRARGGRHNNNTPCEGMALGGTLYGDGTANWKKEIWHTGGYTDAKGTSKVTGPIIDRWVGWKVVMYNIQNNQAVKMESYIDDGNNNKWRKVTDLIDDGQWYANTPDDVFYSANCERSKDYIITNSGSIATFRADNVALNFKNLSIREIQPPVR
jgi:hypothetical protein